MTESLGEIRAALAVVADQLAGAQQHAGVARHHIDDAVGVLTALGGHHSEPLVPPQLHRAAAQLDSTLGLIGSGAQVVAAIAARI